MMMMFRCFPTAGWRKASNIVQVKYILYDVTDFTQKWHSSESIMSVGKTATVCPTATDTQQYRTRSFLSLLVVINPNSCTDAGRELGPDPRERFEVAGIDGVALLE